MDLAAAFVLAENSAKMVNVLVASDKSIVQEAASSQTGTPHTVEVAEKSVTLASFAFKAIANSAPHKPHSAAQVAAPTSSLVVVEPAQTHKIASNTAVPAAQPVQPRKVAVQALVPTCKTTPITAGPVAIAAPCLLAVVEPLVQTPSSMHKTAVPAEISAQQDKAAALENAPISKQT